MKTGEQLETGYAGVAVLEFTWVESGKTFKRRKELGPCGVAISFSEEEAERSVSVGT